MATLSTVNPVDPRLRPSVAKAMLNKVPEVTLYFWVIKVLCTTVGETAADYLNETLGWGLTNTTYVMSAVLTVALGERAFDPGVRGEGANDGGAGLGLALARRLARSCGGDVTLGDGPGGCFVLDLPAIERVD